MLQNVVYTAYAATQNFPYIILGHLCKAQLDDEKVSQKLRYFFIRRRGFFSCHIRHLETANER